MDEAETILKDIGVRYPLNRPKAKQVWRPGKGSPFLKLESLARAARSLHLSEAFEPGRCYTNTERISMAGMALEKKLVPYSGWMFDTLSFRPVHHAWAVYGKYCIIDLSLIRNMVPLYQSLHERFDIKGKEYEAAGKDPAEFQLQWRMDWLEALRPFENGDVVENRVWGVCPEGMYYAGCPCDMMEARFIYQKWCEKNPEVLAMPGEKSVTQMIHELVKNGLTPEQIRDRLLKGASHVQEIGHSREGGVQEPV